MHDAAPPDPSVVDTKTALRRLAADVLALDRSDARAGLSALLREVGATVAEGAGRPWSG